jgi:hypothetical protein
LFVHSSPEQKSLVGTDAAFKSAIQSEFSIEGKVMSLQSISPPVSNTAANRENALSVQDLSGEEYNFSQSSAGAAPDHDSSNSSSEKPSFGLKSSFKFLAKMVQRTLAVKRKVQLVNLKSIISSQCKWRANSEGYQNLFEFGASALYSIFHVVFSREFQHFSCSCSSWCCRWK